MLSKALVLLSGGQDSTTCLYWAKKRYRHVVAINIFYGQRHFCEVESAKKIAEIAKIELIEMDLSFLFQQIGDSALLNNYSNITSNHRGNNSLPASFVPGRNIIFLSVAAMIAYKKGIETIVIGVCQTDYSGYPDCRQDTIDYLTKTLRKGMNSFFLIHTPLMELDKKSTVELAVSLDGCFEALAYSHTCYEGQIPPCGVCPACVLRAKGFKEAGITDPLIERVRGEK